MLDKSADNLEYDRTAPASKYFRHRCDNCNAKIEEIHLVYRVTSVNPFKLQVDEWCGYCVASLIESKRQKQREAMQPVINEAGETIMVKKERKHRQATNSRPYQLDIELKEETTEALRLLRHHLYARKSSCKDEAVKKELETKIEDLKKELIRRKEYHGK